MDESFQRYLRMLGYLIDYGDNRQGIMAVELLEGIMREAYKNRKGRIPNYHNTMNILAMARLAIQSRDDYNEEEIYDECD